MTLVFLPRLAEASGPRICLPSAASRFPGADSDRDVCGKHKGECSWANAMEEGKAAGEAEVGCDVVMRP